MSVTRRWNTAPPNSRPRSIVCANSARKTSARWVRENFRYPNGRRAHCRFQIDDIDDCRWKKCRKPEALNLKSKIYNLKFLPYSIVDPKFSYLYFFPSQYTTDDISSPSPFSSM